MKPLPRPAVAALFLALAAAGCSPKEQTSEGRKFAVTYQTLNNPFFKDLNEGLLSVIRGRGDELDVFDASFNAQKQASQLSDMLRAGYEGIFLNPVNWKGVGRSLDEARREGVPVIVVDAPVEDEDLVVATVASDNFQAGVLAGDALKGAKPEGAKIIALTLSVNKACRDRLAGFKEALAGDPRYVIDTERDLEAGTAEAALPKMQDLLLRVPDVDAVFAINDPAAFGVLRALDMGGKTGVLVLAVDGSRKAVQEIREGRLFSSSAQFPFEIGRRAAQAMYDHLDGKTVPREIKVEVELVDRSNAEDFLRRLEAGGKDDSGAGPADGKAAAASGAREG